MVSSLGNLSIAASTPKLDVDNRISLRFYYRIATNLLKQASIYRQENNIIDLYIMLVRFSSLITETIPSHKDYHACMPRERLLFREKLLRVLGELESLQPDVKIKIHDWNSRSRIQQSKDSREQQKVDTDDPFVWPTARKSIPQTNFNQVHKIVGQNGYSYGTPIQFNQASNTKPLDRQVSMSLLQPKAETLLRHSILGPDGLHGRWHPPISNLGIRYPSNLELTPVDFPSILERPKDQNDATDNSGTSEPVQRKSVLEEVLSLQEDDFFKEERPSDITSVLAQALTEVDLIKQPNPPPVLARVEDLVLEDSVVSNPTSAHSVSLQDDVTRSEAPLEVHISTILMDSFMEVAKSNTDRNLETCGVLAGSLKNRKFYVTALIIPKQEGTSDSCQTTNEEEIFDYQDEKSLFPLGWIHTHPTQTCFMSSIDLHTHYSYQIMLPEAIAIVMAPKAGSRTHGIFRLTSPGGISVIRNCQQRGFHPHLDPPDGGPIYDHCSDIYMNPTLKFDVVDLR